MTLNPLQFSPRDQTLPGMPFPQAERPVPAVRENAVSSRWSGIAPGQSVMGVHDVAKFGEADPHGFVHESQSAKTNPITGRVDLNEADHGGDGVPARSFYATVGGKYHRDPMVSMHWATQPTHQVPSNTIIHTAQHWERETESGTGNPLTRVPEGRQRIDGIRADLEAGGRINKPAWLMKHNDRLYALDGHHRIVAAREAGHETFPAKIWDRDAEQKNA